MTTEQRDLDIIRRYKRGERQWAIAAYHNLSQAQVSTIVRRNVNKCAMCGRTTLNKKFCSTDCAQDSRVLPITELNDILEWRRFFGAWAPTARHFGYSDKDNTAFVYRVYNAMVRHRLNTKEFWPVTPYYLMHQHSK